MDDRMISALNNRLTEMGQAAGGAERSLQAACRALREIQAMCETQVPEKPDDEHIAATKTQAARADVSLSAVADEVERVSDALRAVAGLDEA